MTVYVDNAQIQYGRMKMCHMVADTEDELLAMADKIGVQRKWHQYPGTPKSHFDVCMSKRALAIKHGAREVTRRELMEVRKNQRATALLKAVALMPPPKTCPHGYPQTVRCSRCGE